MRKKIILSSLLFSGIQVTAMSFETVATITKVSVPVVVVIGRLLWDSKEDMLANAIKHNRYTIAKWLMMLGADSGTSNRFLPCKDTALHHGVIYSNMEIFSLLLSKATDIDVRNSNGFTPLLSAVFFCRQEKVALLLKHGANPDAADKKGNTSFHWAALNGFIKIAQLLLQKGAKINMPNNSRNTPLHRAAARGKADMVRFLLLNGADAELANEDEVKPYDLADEYGYIKTAQLLKGVGQAPKALAKNSPLKYLFLREMSTL